MALMGRHPGQPDGLPDGWVVGAGRMSEVYDRDMGELREIEFIFEPQEEGGYHVYAPDLLGLHTQGETLADATDNAREALELYVEGAREEGRPLVAGVVRRTLAVSA